MKAKTRNATSILKDVIRIIANATLPEINEMTIRVDSIFIFFAV